MDGKKLVIVRVPLVADIHTEGLIKDINDVVAKFTDDFVFIVIHESDVDRIEFEYPKNNNWYDAELEAMTDEANLKSYVKC